MAVRRMNASNDDPDAGSPDWHRRYLADQAAERRRRGMTGFTRPEHGEAIEGTTPGESPLRSGQRGSQVSYPKRKKK